MKRTKTTLGAAIALAATLVPLSAQAQVQPGFAVNKYEPAERGSHWFANESLDYRGKLRTAVGVTGDYSYRQLLIFDPDGDVNASVVRNTFFVHTGANLVVADRLRVGFNLPIQAIADGHPGTVVRDGVTTNFLPPPKGSGLGDLRLGADLRLLGAYGAPVTMALGMQVWVPIGSEAQYAGDGQWRIKPRVMFAGDVGNFTYAAQVAVNWRARNERVGPGTIGSEFNLTVAAGLKALDRKLVVGPELWGSTVFDDPFGRKTTPLEAALGAHYLIANQVQIGLATAAGITRSYGAPVVRVLFSIEWAPGLVEDRDGDGINNREDACPDQSGVASTDAATNGCPEGEVGAVGGDRDKDGIPDSADACPVVPGVKTEDPATNGCKDTDGDGVYDPKDACPNEKGVANADATVNGCPDSDGDGVFDKVDACPTQAGDKSDDPKKTGCPPDPDRDKDGIPNTADACPDEPGKPDPDPKKNGCPKAFISAGQIKILDQVKFKPGSATIEMNKPSLDVLEAIQKVLVDHAEVKHVRVEGHTDNTGVPKLNKKLSADRAASVVSWLVGKGVSKDRLASVGMGADRPVDTNTTEEGRKSNRRVEFHIE